jgi:hypothetical protein
MPFMTGAYGSGDRDGVALVLKAGRKLRKLAAD